MNNTLSFRESNRYLLLVQKIKTWKDNTLEVGMYIREIRDQRLYRRDYDSFEEFLVKELDVSRSHGYRLLEFAEISENPEGKDFENEHQFRKSKVSPIGDISGKSEPKKSSESSQIGQKDQKSKVIQLDGEGYPIPEDLVEDWNRALDIGKDLIQKASELKCQIDQGQKNDDVAYRSLSVSTLTHAMNLYSSLKEFLPHAVCKCGGSARERKSCKVCKQKGYLSKLIWASAIPEDFKKMRKAK